MAARRKKPKKSDDEYKTGDLVEWLSVRCQSKFSSYRRLTMEYGKASQTLIHRVIQADDMLRAWPEKPKRVAAPKIATCSQVYGVTIDEPVTELTDKELVEAFAASNEYAILDRREAAEALEAFRSLPKSKKVDILDAFKIED